VAYVYTVASPNEVSEKICLAYTIALASWSVNRN
jgi:hypothetical protein